MELRDAALALNEVLSGQEWLVAVGVRSGGDGSPFAPQGAPKPLGSLIVYTTSIRRAERVVPLVVGPYRVLIEKMGRPRPASALAS